MQIQHLHVLAHARPTMSCIPLVYGGTWPVVRGTYVRTVAFRNAPAQVQQPALHAK